MIWLQIPWFYSELNGSDTFLLRTDSTVFIWNGESYKKEPAELCSRNHKEETARALEYRIRHYDNRNFLTKLRTGSMDLEFPKYFETFKNTFFFHMQDVPPSKDFPTQPEFIPDNEIWRKRNVCIVRVLHVKIFLFYLMLWHVTEWRIHLMHSVVFYFWNAATCGPTMRNNFCHFPPSFSKIWVSTP